MKYYILSIKWTNENDEVFTFWQKNCSGYTHYLENAGLYDEDKTKINEGIIYVPKEIVDKYAIKITHRHNQKEYMALPNRGHIRKELNMTVLDFKYSDRTYRNFDFENEHVLFDIKDKYIEELKRVNSEYYRVTMQPNTLIDEEWYCNDIFKAETRNQAIIKANQEWILDLSYLEMKSIVSAKREKVKVFVGWKEAS